MDNKENKKGNGGGIASLFHSAVDTVKTKAQDIKLPEVKIPDIKLPEIKLPEIKLPKLQFSEKSNKQGEDTIGIRTLSARSVIKIVYYMMAVDGEILDQELAEFDEIGKELDPNYPEIKELIISECQHQLQKQIDPEDYFAVLQDGIEDAVSEGENVPDAVITPKILVWDLLTIAFSDGKYHEKERQLLKYVVRKLDVDKTVFLEMESSFQALMDLENELQWIKTTDRPYLTIEAIVNEIADRKTAIFDSVKDLISL